MKYDEAMNTSQARPPRAQAGFAPLLPKDAPKSKDVNHLYATPARAQHEAACQIISYLARYLAASMFLPATLHAPRLDTTMPSS